MSACQFGVVHTWRRAAVAGLLLLAWVCTACTSNPAKTPAAAQKSGFWLTRIADHTALQAVSHRGSTFWAWSPRYSLFQGIGGTQGLHLMHSHTGTDMLPSPLLPEWYVDRVMPSGSGERTWVEAFRPTGPRNAYGGYSDTSLEFGTFLVGPAPKYETQRCAELSDAARLERHRLILSEDGLVAWQTTSGLLTVVGKPSFFPSAGVLVRTCQTVQRLFTDRYPLEVAPITGSERAWLLSSPRPANGSWNPMVGAKQLAIVDRYGNVVSDLTATLPGAPFYDAAFSRHGDYAWLSREAGGISVIAKDGQPVGGGNPLPLPPGVDWDVTLSPGGRTGYLLPDLPLRRGMPHFSAMYVYRLNDAAARPVEFAQGLSAFDIVVGESDDEVWARGSRSVHEVSVRGDVIGKWTESADVVPIQTGRSWFIQNSSYGGRTNGLFLIESPDSRPDVATAPLSNFLRDEALVPPHALDDGHTLLLSNTDGGGEDHSWLAHDAMGLEGFSIAFDGQPVSNVDASVVSVRPEQVSLAVQLPLLDGRIPKGNVSVTVVDAARGEVAGGGTPVPEPRETAEIRLGLRPGKAWRFSERYRVELSYSDEYGSRLAVAWPDVRFEPPWLSHPKVRSVILVAMVLAVWLVLLRVGPAAPAVTRWLPSIVAVTSGGVVHFPEVAQSVDAPTVVVLLGALVLAGLPVGLVSPAAFRTLAQAAPFHWCAPWALLLPMVRRRLYGSYVTALQAQLRGAREGAQHETYVSVPVRIVAESTRNERVTDAPIDAREVARRWAADDVDTRRTVVIESPGGRGKSALLREVIRLVTDEFVANDRLPLPVVCRGEDDSKASIEDLMRQALGRHIVSEEVFQQELARGGFLPVVDGLTESTIGSGTVLTYCRNANAEACPLLTTKRPEGDRGGEILNALESAPRWVRLEPLRLDQNELANFERSYIEEDAKRGVAGKPLSAGLQKICQAGDGTFLPILVRLCIVAGDDSAETVKDIYEGAFNVLLKGSNEEPNVDQAAALCVDTYWKDGRRSLLLGSVAADKRACVQLLIESNMLVPTVRNRVTGDPQEVSFFHDSMQSFLTASGLFRLPDAWDHFGRAAGDPLFAKGQAEFSGIGVPELFAMCLAVYGPKDLVRERLRLDLERWSADLDDELQKKHVKLAIPPSAVAPLSRVNQQLGAGQLLRHLADQCRDSLEDLAYIYARIAPRAWQAMVTRPPATPVADRNGH